MLLQHPERLLQQPPSRPLLQPAPTGLAARQTQLTVGHLQPGRVREQHVQNSFQTGASGITAAARMTKTALRIGKQRLQPPPERVRDEPLQRLRATHPPPLRTTI